MGFPAISARDGTTLTGLGPGKPLALLVYLAVRHEARREELVDLLWGEATEANARNAFRQALHRLRSALGEELVPPDRDRVVLTSSSALAVDRDEFLDALDRDDVLATASLYRGDFLEGFDVGEPMFDSWADAERLRLRSRFQTALHKGAEASLANGRWLEALQLVQRLSGIAPYDESAALLEANILLAAGRGTEAAAALRRFSQLLRDQLDLQPSPRFAELLTRVERTESRPAAETSQRKAATSPFVGRESELGRLMGAVRALAEERGGTLLIEGPAGIGKSRLVEELLNRARSTGPILTLRGRERPLSANLPYASIAEALRGILKAPGISGTGRHLLSEAARILPELRDHFELPDPAPIADEGGRLRFFEGVAALLDAAAYEQPICLVFDDMHNASASSLELLAYLAARLQSSPVCILVLYRRDPGTGLAAERLGALASQDARDPSGRNILRLGPLTTEDLRLLVSGMISGVHDQIDADRIIAAADGNPMRALELSRRALDGDAPTSAPARLRDVLWSRFQKTSPAQRRVFFAAALLNRRAPLRLLATAAHLPEATTLDAAAALESFGLIEEQGDGFIVPHDFALAFVSEASGLAGRALLAGWAADALSSEPGATGAELAHLYSMAGHAAPAFTNARRGAFESAAVGADPEVHRLLDLALTLAPDPSSRAEIESMRAAFGAGRRLLAMPAFVAERGAPPVPPVADIRSTTADRQTSPPPAPAAANREPRRSFATPRLYWLTAVLVAATALLVWRRSPAASAGQHSLADSLLVVERGADSGTSTSVITGSLSGAPVRLASVDATPSPWTDALPKPWRNPLPSPSGRFVAIERMTDGGTDVYLLQHDTVDRIPVAVGGGDDVVMDWAPDGSALLLRRGRTLADGSFDADLWTFRVGQPRLVAVPVDTSAERSIREARWSPDGTRIAWVAQVGAKHQQDVFVSRADGSGMENLTQNAAEDYHISWSSDGNLLAFTSDRSGNPDLFAIEFEGASRRLWTLTRGQYPEDHAVFSPDDRYVAFQSTRDSDAAVYVMPALGGTITRVTPSKRQYSLAGWRGRANPVYVDRFRIIGPSSMSLGDSTAISLLGVDRGGTAHILTDATLSLLDPSVADLTPVDTEAGAHRFSVKAKRVGVARLVASIPGWRYDTLTIRVGGVTTGSLIDDFHSGIDQARWLSLGFPAPTAKQNSLFPNGDLQWQSGLLSREAFTLHKPLEASATLLAPFGQRALPAALLEIALVADGRDESFDRSAPQFSEIAVVAWDGEASRVIYSVGAESKADPLSVIGSSGSHAVRIAVDREGNVSFFVDSRLRWTSSLRFLGNVGEPRARLWIGGRATASASISSVRVVQP
jgi:DNA-binding SARP family transcriptional activator